MQAHSFRDDAVIQGMLVGKREMPRKEMSALTVRIKTQKGNDDYPEVLFFGDDYRATQRFREGDFIKITGRIESKPFTLTKTEGGISTKVTKYEQAIIGKAIDNAITREEKNGCPIKGHLYDNECQVILSGVICSTKVYGDNRLSIAVYTEVDGRPNRIAASLFSENVEDEKLKYERGDEVFIMGVIQTLPPKRGKPRKETIVIRAINILAKSEHDNQIIESVTEEKGGIQSVS